MSTIWPTNLNSYQVIFLIHVFRMENLDKTKFLLHVKKLSLT